MAVNPTLYSRVSIGWWNSAQSLIDKDPADSGAVFSVKGPYSLDGAGTIGGAQTFSGAVAGTSTVSFNGAATFQSTVTARGQATFAAVLAQSGATFNSTVSIGGAVTQIGAVAGFSTVSYNGAATLQSTLTVRGASTFDGAQVLNSTMSVGGASTFQSTVTARGQINADAGVQIGGGTVAQLISSVTTSLTFGAIVPLDSSSVLTVALSGASRLDTIIITPDSTWHQIAANRDIGFFASSGSTTGEVSVWAVNSTLTSVTPTAATPFRLTRIKFGNFPAA